MPAPPAALGDEVFVYGPSQLSADAPLWQGLAASRLPVRVFVPDVPASYRAKLSGMGLRAESAPLPFSQIARRSRLLVSYSSHGFVCSGLVCGIPQVVCPVDLEKALVAQAVVKLGVAGVAAPGQIRPAAFGSSLRDLYHDASLAAAARNAAPRFRERVTRSDTELVVREIDRLL
jgi:UDP:flavonoid glycosyltransferase YjiC (YdhE family)